MRFCVLVSSLLLVVAPAYSQVPIINYSLFDNAVDNGKSFESAFPQSQVISGLKINSDYFMLQGEWTILNSWFTLGEMRSGKKYSNGYLVLGKVKDDKLIDIMGVMLSLQRSNYRGIMSDVSSACKPGENVVHSEVLRAEDKYQSCTRIRSLKFGDVNENLTRYKNAVINYAKVHGLKVPAAGEEYFSTQINETKNAAGVYILRETLKSYTSLEEQVDFSRAIRSSIRNGFLTY